MTTEVVATLDHDQMAWGWRIPFLASVLIMGFAIWVRLSLKESPVFEAREDVVDGEAVSTEKLAEVVDFDTLAQAAKSRKGRSFFAAFFLRFGQAGNSGMI